MFSPARTVCLTLDSRAQKGCRQRIQDEIQEHRLDLHPLTFLAGDGRLNEPYDHRDIEPPRRDGTYPAWLKRPNSYNAFLCFRSIIEKARHDRLDNLLLLEDDVTFRPGCRDMVESAWQQLQQTDPEWKMFYLGANHSFRPTRFVNFNLLLLNGSGCFHCVLLSQRVFDEILALPMEGPIDGMAGQLIHPGGHCYGIWPNIAWTTPGFSHCEGREVDYSDMFTRRQ